MRMYDIIEKKRDGHPLTEEEIRFFVEGYTDGSIPDYQASALCMAIYFRGMNDQEISILTDAMAHSGDMLDLSRFGTLSADKHSTGGVGDKTSLIVMPIIAALGAKVAKMTGRGLGHTGGTVDKLESIPGYNVTLDGQTFMQQVEDIGISLIGQSGNMTPADKKLYALRDVTATVDSIPLITSSIMCKKLAAGAHNIVLDVKVGSGAFMKTVEDARELATKMTTIGRLCGRNIAAVLTNMNQPLGHNIGNALEVQEAVEVLNGGGPDDMKQVCLALASALASMVFQIPHEEAVQRAEEALASGAAFQKMVEWIGRQGGDVRYLKDTSLFPKCSCVYEVKAAESGYIQSMDAEQIGLCSVLLGAGRATKEESIDPAAGIILNKKIGAPVNKGDVLCTLYTNREAVIPTAEQQYIQAVRIGAEAPEEEPLIYDIIR